MLAVDEPRPARGTGRHARGLHVVGVLQAHDALVHLGLHAHHGEDALRAGQRREQEVALLRELVERRRCLAHEDEVARERPHVHRPAHGEQRAHDGDDGVVDVAHAHGHRHHRGRVGLRRRPRLAQALVEPAEAREVGGLVVEDLHDLLPRDHLLHVAVEPAQLVLLAREEPPAAPAREPNVERDGGVARHRNEREAPVEDQKQRERAHDPDRPPGRGSQSCC